MLGVLGIFKARGTKVFNEFVGKTAQIAGGALTSMMAIKCVLGTQVYGPFLVNMGMPIGAALLVMLIMIPTTFMRRMQERWQEKGDTLMRTRRERAALDSADDDENIFVPPRHMPLFDFGNRYCKVPTNISLAIPFCRVPATEEYIASQLRRYQGQRPNAPLLRPRFPIDPRLLGGVPLAVLMSCACCRVATTESERSHWRAAAAARKQRTKFKPQRRFVAVMVLVMYSLFPTLVASTAGMFNCSDEIGGERYLMADLTVTCYKGWHIVYLAGACVSIVVYCIGTPIVLAFVIMFDLCSCSSPTCTAAEPDLDGDAELDATLRQSSRQKFRQYCPSCVCICNRRDGTPWGYRTESTRERFGLLIAGYDTKRGVLVMAWEPLVVMIRKLFITLAGALKVLCCPSPSRSRAHARTLAPLPFPFHRHAGPRPVPPDYDCAAHPRRIAYAASARAAVSVTAHQRA